MRLPDYDFKLSWETAKVGLVALLAYLFTLGLDFSDDLDAIFTDWEAYVKSIAPGAAAAVCYALLGLKTRPAQGTGGVDETVKPIAGAAGGQTLIAGDVEFQGISSLITEERAASGGAPLPELEPSTELASDMNEGGDSPEPSPHNPLDTGPPSGGTGS